MDYQIMAEGLAFPEGPIAMADGSLILVELVGGRLSRVWGDGKKEVIAQLGGGPNGAQLGPDGAVYVCNNGGSDLVEHCHLDTPEATGRIERIDLSTGKFERIFDHCGDFPLRAPNDLVFDAQGGLWFTDMGKHLKRGSDHAGLYYAAADGSAISEVYYGGITFNGVGLSPDETALFVTETMTARVYRFDLDGPGVCRKDASGRAARTLVGTVPGDVWIDSCAVLQSGGLAIGTIYDGGITTLAPEGQTRHDPMPDAFTTNIAFGGDDMQDAYITLGLTGRVVATRWPEPGLKLNFSQR